MDMNETQLKIFISAYDDAYKAWVKELIMKENIDWLWMCLAVNGWMVKAFQKINSVGEKDLFIH